VIDPENIDKEFLRKAEVEVEKGLRMSARPKDTFYVILLAIAQQKGDYHRLAELLELLVKQYPQKKDYWPQLAGVYGNLAALEKDEQKVREYNIRSINAIERAQALGFMKTPKENYTLFGLYFNVGQFGRATEILHAGLRDGSIESDQKNWELLASSYQQVDQPFKAIEALTEGAKKFPKSGQLDYQAATIYYSLNQPEGAYKALQAATTKGGLSKPGAVYAFMGYVCWELGKHAEALEAINKAMTFPDTKNDKQLPQLKQAVEEALQERNSAEAAKAP
jgi:predicted Zn-dependent protease